MSYFGQIAAEGCIEHIQRTGLWQGKTAKTFNVIGARNDGYTSTSVLQDMAEYLDNSQAGVNTPSSGTTLYVVSTSELDTSAGVGARTVKIWYLDASYDLQSKSATLNGTTAVSISTGHSYILYMETTTAGSNNVAVGNISVTSTNGAATVATTFEQIKSGGNRSMSARFMIPNGYTGYVAGWQFSSIGGATQDARLRSTCSQIDRAVTTGIFHFEDRIQYDTTTSIYAKTYCCKLPELTEIKVSTLTGSVASTNDTQCSFYLVLLQD